MRLSSKVRAVASCRLDARYDMLDIAVALQLPVLLVVGMRLGAVSITRC